MIRTALFSGSFNPIHTGHLILASYLCQYEQVDEVWFVVSPQNPLKPASSLLADEHRIAMVKLAIAGNPHFRYCDIEMELPRPSYTIHTLDALRERYGAEHEFTLIVGADNWNILHRWRDYERLLSDYHLLVYPRMGYSLDNPLGLSMQQVTLSQAPIVEVSSTFVREGIAAHKNMNYFLPSEVWNYIVAHQLYSNQKG